jgi:hypothetical protein
VRFHGEYFHYARCFPDSRSWRLRLAFQRPRVSRHAHPRIAPRLVSSSEGPVPRVPRDGGLFRDWLFYTSAETPMSSASTCQCL